MSQHAKQQAAALLATWTQESSEPEPDRLDVWVRPGNLLPAVRALQDAAWGYLSAITGLDLGLEMNQLEVLYHFCTGPVVVTLRIRVERAGAVIPTVCDIIPSASFFERELAEMFGITVEDTPVPDRLFLPESWPEGVYPLLKDFVFEHSAGEQAQPAEGA